MSKRNITDERNTVGGLHNERVMDEVKGRPYPSPKNMKLPGMDASGDVSLWCGQAVTWSSRDAVRRTTAARGNYPN